MSNIIEGEKKHTFLSFDAILWWHKRTTPGIPLGQEMFEDTNGVIRSNDQRNNGGQTTTQKINTDYNEQHETLPPPPPQKKPG